jgi:hypothetical protein
MDIMEVFAVILMIIGFSLGFWLATRAAFKVIDVKNAIIADANAAVKAQHVVADNYRDALQKYHRNFPTVMAELDKELSRRANFSYEDLESHDIADEGYCRYLFDTEFCLKESCVPSNKETTINKVEPVNTWPDFFDSLDDIETPESYWDNFVVPTPSSVRISIANYELLEKTSQYGGIKMKWSTINGREFGKKRKFKIKRSESRAAKRLNKSSWLAYNEAYEEELFHTAEKVILQNKRDAFLLIK